MPPFWTTIKTSKNPRNQELIEHWSTRESGAGEKRQHLSNWYLIMKAIVRSDRTQSTGLVSAKGVWSWSITRQQNEISDCCTSARSWSRDVNALMSQPSSASELKSTIGRAGTELEKPCGSQRLPHCLSAWPWTPCSTRSGSFAPPSAWSLDSQARRRWFWPSYPGVETALPIARRGTLHRHLQVDHAWRPTRGGSGSAGFSWSASRLHRAWWLGAWRLCRRWGASGVCRPRARPRRLRIRHCRLLRWWIPERKRCGARRWMSMECLARRRSSLRFLRCS